MASQDRLLSATDIFSNLGNHQIAPAFQSTYAWRLIARSATSDELHIALDYAHEHEILPADIVDSMRSGELGGSRTPSWLNETDGSELILIPSGPFLAGREKLPAEAEGFFLARHPVTNAQFQRFVSETGYAPTDEGADSFLNHWSKNASVPKNKEDHPVVWVSFFDALQYCRWAGLMLPTEWLWEKAARGGDGREYPWGSSHRADGLDYRARSSKLAQVAKKTTCAVGKHSSVRTPYGCEDMVGNVSEWCIPGNLDDVGSIPGEWPVDDASSDAALDLAAVRGSAYMRRQFQRMVSGHQRRLTAARRTNWVGFRPALLPTIHPLDVS